MNRYDSRAKEIGARIKEERTKMGLSVKAFLLKIFMSESSHKTVLAWERGERLPDLDSLVRMSELFNCDVGYLLCDYNERTRDCADVCAVTGLSEKAVSYIVDRKKTADLHLSSGVDALNGLDALLNSHYFQDTLPRIAQLVDGCKQQNAIELELKKKCDEYDRMLPDLDSLSDEEKFYREVALEDIWEDEKYTALSRDNRLLEYHVSQQFTFMLRDITFERGCSTDSV